VTVNALCVRVSGRCPLQERHGRFLLLFPASAVFWWFFEYLNRFVQNWHYTGVEDFSRLEYACFASLSFSTVLPAVWSTYVLLREAGAGRALADGIPIRVARPRSAAAAALAASGAGLFLMSVWPDVLFPLVWVAPLLVLTSLQTLAGRKTVFSDIREGDWRRVCLLAAAALICGFFWEMWNVWSVPKWRYAVPFVNRFRIFEMPVLGYAGYLPFGLQCGAAAVLVLKSSGRLRKKRAEGGCRRNPAAE